MPMNPGIPSLSGTPFENTEIISKTMIRPLSYTPPTEEGARPYPMSRTDRGVSRDRQGDGRRTRTSRYGLPLKCGGSVPRPPPGMFCGVGPISPSGLTGRTVAVGYVLGWRDVVVVWSSAAQAATSDARTNATAMYPGFPMSPNSA